MNLVQYSSDMHATKLVKVGLKLRFDTQKWPLSPRRGPTMVGRAEAAPLRGADHFASTLQRGHFEISPRLGT